MEIRGNTSANPTSRLVRQRFSISVEPLTDAGNQRSGLLRQRLIYTIATNSLRCQALSWVAVSIVVPVLFSRREIVVCSNLPYLLKWAARQGYPRAPQFPRKSHFRASNPLCLQREATKGRSAVNRRGTPSFPPVIGGSRPTEQMRSPANRRADARGSHWGTPSFPPVIGGSRPTEQMRSLANRRADARGSHSDARTISAARRTTAEARIRHRLPPPRIASPIRWPLPSSSPSEWPSRRPLLSFRRRVHW